MLDYEYNTEHNVAIDDIIKPILITGSECRADIGCNISYYIQADHFVHAQLG